MDALREQEYPKTSNVYTIMLELYAFLHAQATNVQRLRICRNLYYKSTKLKALLSIGTTFLAACAVKSDVTTTNLPRVMNRSTSY
jgi:hypothetical protein